MKTKQILIDKSKLEKKYAELQNQVENLKKKYTEELFKILNEAYRIGKIIHGNRFNYKQLARDFKLSVETVRRILSLRRANRRTWKLIKEGKIPIYKVTYVLTRRATYFQDELIDLIINKNLTVEDIVRLRKGSLDEINDARQNKSIKEGYAQRLNAYRAIIHLIERMEKVLEIKPVDIPASKIYLLKNRLEGLNKKIRKYIKDIKKV